MNLTFQLLFSHIVWFEYDSECKVPLSKLSKRFQSSYGAKVRAGAKKTRWKWEGEGRRGSFPKSWGLRATSVSFFPLPLPCHSLFFFFVFFFAVVPTFLDKLARKRLLRRLSSAISIPVSKGGAVSSFCVPNLSRIPLLCCLTLPLQVCIE